jgi:hypothetical protein
MAGWSLMIVASQLMTCFGDLQLSLRSRGLRTDRTFQVETTRQMVFDNMNFYIPLVSDHESCQVLISSWDQPVSTSYAQIWSGFYAVFGQCVRTRALGGYLEQPPYQFTIRM